ncbi:hypothetical protein EMIHUDRAFT_217914 [Emiliania huxleyi CCMP1516]|uniref:HMG box domain-containing protein n=2 Tax=Emiliania huxleyi TaxID=2903 RepID=A0A0D3I9I8_EMIH1|nr:hypothetical protein EMIHUDRAFT_217914 [Emiliania huxleyi CCMP1516]EOD07923.1 hypothetical protein EMIHUDRAFT_217914 [Emiliania huxleyi CCMP1516]|eukprot:XP_005760352.1 hypothetical protein EMIHUDRAFT_217914 [Emiliania huxleyi CCMP1516]
MPLLVYFARRMRLTAAASSSGKAPWRIFRHQNEARFKFLILRLLEHRNRAVECTELSAGSAASIAARPVRAFSLFVRAQSESLKRTQPDQGAAAVRKAVEASWQSLSDAQRAVYVQAAREHNAGIRKRQTLTAPPVAVQTAGAPAPADTAIVPPGGLSAAAALPASAVLPGGCLAPPPPLAVSPRPGSSLAPPAQAGNTTTEQGGSEKFDVAYAIAD